MWEIRETYAWVYEKVCGKGSFDIYISQKILSHILSCTSLNIVILKCKSKQNKRNTFYNMTL